VFDIGWSEMAIIMLVALVVIGPRDLPRLARSVGQWVAKGRAMAREFQRSLEEMAREAELDDVKREIEKVGRTDIGKTIEKTIDPSGDLGKAFKPLSASDNKALAKSAGASAANGEAKAIAKPEPKAEPEAVAPAPEAAAPVKTAATKPKVTKPRATTAKADTAKTATTKATKTAGKAGATAKPKTAAKPAAPAKPRTSRAAPKTASSEAGEAEAIAEPADARGA
jgi:sec-independent protein translocase protein TatB